jgi:tetratricopeptide (TPR) repeat protein
MLDLAPEGRQYGDKFVALIDETTPPADAARVLRYAGSLWREADRQRGVALLERSVALYRQIGHRLDLGCVLGLLGSGYFFLGRHDEARAALDEAWAILSGTSRLKSQVSVMNSLGLLAVGRNDTDEARQHTATALDLARRTGDILRINNALLNLADVEFCRGASGQAIEFAREAESGFRTGGFTSYLARALTNLGEYLALSGDHAGAQSAAIEALSLLAGEGGHWLRLDLQVFALRAAQDGRYAEAAQVQGWVDAGYARTGEIREPNEQKVREAVTAILAAQLEPESVQAFLTEGATWSEGHAVDYTRRRIIAPKNP